MAGYKTNEIIPRTYGVVINGNIKLFIAPAYSAIGSVLRAPASKLREELKSWQDYKRQKAAYTPLFPVPEKYYYVLGADPHDLCDIVSSAIKKKEGSYSLWRAGVPDDVESRSTAILDAHLGPDVLTGMVKSRRGGNKKNGTAYRTIVSVKSPFVLKDGSPGFTDFDCQCEDKGWNATKQGQTVIRTMCAHCAALLEQMYAEHHGLTPERIEYERKIIKEPLLPFNFLEYHDQQEFSAANLGFDYLEHGEQPPISHLKMDALLSSELYEDGHYEINKKLLKLPQIYHPAILRGIKSGKITFEVLKQREKTRSVDPNILGAEKYLTKNILKKLIGEGYVLNSTTVEFMGTGWETVCDNYEKQENGKTRVVRLLFNPELPLSYVSRTRQPNDKVIPFYENENEHPFKSLFTSRQTIDDMTRMATRSTVGVPLDENIPEPLIPLYRGAIDEHYPGGICALKARLEQNLGDKAANFTERVLS